MNENTVVTLLVLGMFLAALLPLRGMDAPDEPKLHQPPSRGWLEAHGIHIRRPTRRANPTRKEAP